MVLVPSSAETLPSKHDSFTLSLQFKHLVGPAPRGKAFRLWSGSVRAARPVWLGNSDSLCRQNGNSQRNAGVPAGGIREERRAVHGSGRLQLWSGETLQGLMGNLSEGVDFTLSSVCVSGSTGGADRAPSSGERQEVRREIPGQNARTLDR